MPVRPFTLIALMLLVLLGDGGNARARGAAVELDPGAWTIGPMVRGRNYSRDMPLHPSPGPRGSWYIDLPQAPGSVHYVTFPHGSLAGKRRIVMRYRIDAAPGVEIVPSTPPFGPSILTLYFQRAGDSWTGRGRYETYRWYAVHSSHMPITPGEHEIAADFSDDWRAVMNSSSRERRREFFEAMAEADEVGFVLGGGSGTGHGVHATGPARLTVTEFRVE